MIISGLSRAQLPHFSCISRLLDSCLLVVYSPYDILHSVQQAMQHTEWYG